MDRSLFSQTPHRQIWWCGGASFCAPSWLKKTPFPLLLQWGQEPWLIGELYSHEHKSACIFYIYNVVFYINITRKSSRTYESFDFSENSIKMNQTVFLELNTLPSTLLFHMHTAILLMIPATHHVHSMCVSMFKNKKRKKKNQLS